jgi:hypothetical protein
MSENQAKVLLQGCADYEGFNYWAFRDSFTSLRRRLTAGEDISNHR